MENTIEENIYNTTANDSESKWKSSQVTLKNLEDLFTLSNGFIDDAEPE